MRFAAATPAKSYAPVIQFNLVPCSSIEPAATRNCCWNEFFVDSTKTIPRDTIGIAVIPLPQKADVEILSRSRNGTVHLTFRRVNPALDAVASYTLHTDGDGRAWLKEIDFRLMDTFHGGVGYYVIAGYSDLQGECGRTVFRLAPRKAKASAK